MNDATCPSGPAMVAAGDFERHQRLGFLAGGQLWDFDDHLLDRAAAGYRAVAQVADRRRNVFLDDADALLGPVGGHRRCRDDAKNGAAPRSHDDADADSRGRLRAQRHALVDGQILELPGAVAGTTANSNETKSARTGETSSEAKASVRVVHRR